MQFFNWQLGVCVRIRLYIAIGKESKKKFNNSVANPAPKKRVVPILFDMLSKSNC